MTRSSADAKSKDPMIQKLTAANEHLEQFVYVAAHDLRDPLRIIVNFTDLLAREYAGHLDDTGKQYMEINRQAAKKMEAMLTDLLEYGRLGQNLADSSETNCGDVLIEAQAVLSNTIQATQAVIKCDPFPVIAASALRMSHLFQNLLSNALKYQPIGQKPLIRITAHDKTDHWHFTVTDNGIGIKDEYLEFIFAPFKRLHSDQDYAGTGLGLAICKRIVENLHGTIWAESKAGKGSSFHFTIPK